MKDKMKSFKKNNGITLVALIITIIVLLILAIVSIRLVMNGGIIDRANKGVNAYSDAEIEEKVKLAYSELQMAKYTNSNLNEVEFLTESLENQGVTGVQVSGNSTNGFTIKIGDFTYKIAADGNVAVEKPFDPKEWDKTATAEDCFIWASDDPSSSDYGKIIGYTSKIQNYTKIRYPSRATYIKEEYNSERYGDITTNNVRTFVSNIRKIELPQTVGCNFILGGVIPIFENVEEITMPQKCSYTLSNALSELHKLKKVNVPDTMRYIHDYTCAYCYNLEEFNLPHDLSQIQDYAFYHCDSLKKVQIPTVGFVGVKAYASCQNLETVIFEDIDNPGEWDWIDICNEAFEGCTKLKNVKLPNGLRWIDKYAFAGCTSLENLILPNTVKYIEKGFLSNTKVNSIIIPESVETISNYAFSGWGSDKTIYVRATEKPSGWGEDWYKSTYSVSGTPNIVWGYTGE